MADASGQGSAAANNGSTATVDNSDHSDNSSASAEGQSAAANNGGTATVDNTNNSDNSQTTAKNGSAASNGGDATATYSVNNSALEGSVTGQSAGGLSVEEAVALAGGNLSNNISDSFNGAGLNQVAQNLGSSSLVQQQVSFQGNVNVNQ
ncbi:hypothetical protein [Nitrosomonas eutropha]|uniref:hypothetical protein n=1 Tax=Nitrosomonas eutropha TaxID=916 RepID=UPI001C4305E1|nr:hypothetical protein [Nitrosomonas eutropha]